MLVAQTSTAVNIRSPGTPKRACEASARRQLRLFTAAVAVVVPEIHLRAVRQRPRHDVATVGPVARRRDHRLICLADREHAGGGDAVRLVRAGAGTLEHPGFYFAGL